MKAAACPRLFEVEAMRDGRLTGRELARFARHMSSCRECAGEAHALDALAEGLRAGAGSNANLDELQAARARTRLIADFDRALLAPGRMRGARWFLWPAAAAAAAVACGLLVASRAPKTTPPPALHSDAIVRADSDTVWTRRLDGEAEVVTLESGALRIHVDHTPNHRRLVIMLPDGELEDIGTTFTVNVAGRRTTRVSVQEGSVLVRLRGRPPFAVSAGETWPAESTSAPAIEPSRPPPSPERRTALRAAANQRPGPLPAERPSSPDDFHVAVGLLDAGRDCEAAAAFFRFGRLHAGEAHGEDAAYLRVIALQRCGDGDEMKRAATEYLQRYPSGFRRKEMERILR
jgi:hypothetical protein